MQPFMTFSVDLDSVRDLVFSVTCHADVGFDAESDHNVVSP